MNPTYLPKKEVQEAREKAYKRLSDMRDLKHKKFPHFSGPNGDRSFLEYIDDSERILNGYTPSRQAQGKDDWQSNFSDTVTRAKMRAIAAGVGLRVPDTKYSATNKKGLRSKVRAEIMKNTVKHSFTNGNPTLQAFLEVWQMLSHGVLFEYEGYLTGGAKQLVVDSFDSETGEVKTREEYVKVDGKPISVIISPNDFYWADMFKRDVQDQPYIAWLQRYSKSELEREFSKFPNYKYVESKASVSNNSQTQETLHYKAWSERVSDDEYEVFRYFSKEDNEYQIWVNGVDLLRAPLLWGKKNKYYPFAKTISEPFANTEFFVGMSFPGLLEGYQEQKTTITNTLVDKLYRSLAKPFLVGLANKDLLDVESELVTNDDRIYVPDINQVKPFPFEGVSQSDLAMLGITNQAIDRLSIDVNQQGQQGAGVTAREVIVADERARQLKGILFMFLEDLWLQKNRLRVLTILTHYLKDKAVRTSLKDQIITVPDVTFSDGTRGTLDIHIAKSKDQLLSEAEIIAREQVAEQQGLTYKIISITKDYLDEWEYDLEVIPESLYNQDKMKKETDVMDKIQKMITLFPEVFASNKKKFLGEVLDLYGDSPENYDEAPPMPEPMPQAPIAPTPLSMGEELLNKQNVTV